MRVQAHNHPTFISVPLFLPPHCPNIQKGEGVSNVGEEGEKKTPKSNMPKKIQLSSSHDNNPKMEQRQGRMRMRRREKTHQNHPWKKSEPDQPTHPPPHNVPKLKRWGVVGGDGGKHKNAKNQPLKKK